MTYALVNPSNAIDRYSEQVDPSVQTKTGWRWLPVVDTNPTFDIATQIRTGPVITVLSDIVNRVWTVRNKTAPELDTEKTALVDSAAAQVAGQVLFNHENRIRALEAKAPITVAQFKTAIKALLP